jgi:hypothetical protein
MSLWEMPCHLGSSSIRNDVSSRDPVVYSYVSLMSADKVICENCLLNNLCVQYDRLR